MFARSDTSNTREASVPASMIRPTSPLGERTGGVWRPSPWGPVLDDTPGWIGARVHQAPGHAGWALLVRATVEHVELGPEPADGMLGHVRGRYRPIGLEPTAPPILSP